MTPLIQDAPQLSLDETTAARIWNWILARQGLADGQSLATALDVADAALGLHAARLPSPYAIVAARTGDHAVPGSLFTPPVRASLLTVRCMRKTLHVLPLQFAAAAHIATLRFRDRDAQRAILNGGYALGAIDPLVAELAILLRDGPLPHRTIETLIAGTGHDVQAVRLAIKIAWERGIVAYINATDSWNRETRTFALTSSAYPELDLSQSRDHAVTTLITAYFHRYGPATIRDATWWSGLSASDVTAALRRSRRALITVTTPWSAQPCLMFADQVAEALASSALTGIRLLAHEDSALKAYHETRDRYLSGLPQRSAFNQIGEALPTIVIDGIVVGTWSWDTRSRSVSPQVLPGKTTPALRRRIRERAEGLTHTLRAGLNPIPRQAA